MAASKLEIKGSVKCERSLYLLYGMWETKVENGVDQLEDTNPVGSLGPVYIDSVVCVL